MRFRVVSYRPNMPYAQWVHPWRDEPESQCERRLATYFGGCPMTHPFYDDKRHKPDWMARGEQELFRRFVTLCNIAQRKRAKDD
jgi:hypothetical protein